MTPPQQVNFIPYMVLRGICIQTDIHLAETFRSNPAAFRTPKMKNLVMFNLFLNCYTLMPPMRNDIFTLRLGETAAKMFETARERRDNFNSTAKI